MYTITTEIICVVSETTLQTTYTTYMENYNFDNFLSELHAYFDSWTDRWFYNPNDILVVNDISQNAIHNIEDMRLYDQKPYDLSNNLYFGKRFINYKHDYGTCYISVLNLLINKRKKKDIDISEYNENTFENLLKFVNDHTINCIIYTLDKFDKPVIHYEKLIKKDNTYILCTFGHVYILDRKIRKKKENKKTDKKCYCNVTEEIIKVLNRKIIPVNIVLNKHLTSVIINGKQVTKIGISEFTLNDTIYKSDMLNDVFYAQDILGLEHNDKYFYPSSFFSCVLYDRWDNYMIPKSYYYDSFSEKHNPFSYQNKNVVEKYNLYKVDCNKSYGGLVLQTKSIIVHDILSGHECYTDDLETFQQHNNNIDCPSDKLQYLLIVYDNFIFKHITKEWYSSDMVLYFNKNNIKYSTHGVRDIDVYNSVQIRETMEWLLKKLSEIDKVNNKEDYIHIKRIYSAFVTTMCRNDIYYNKKFRRLTTPFESESIDNNIYSYITDNVTCEYDINKKFNYFNSVPYHNQLIDLLLCKLNDFITLNQIPIDQIIEIKIDSIKYYSQYEPKFCEDHSFGNLQLEK